MMMESKAVNAETWQCTRYGVTMSREHVAAFCARRYAAAKQRCARGISFSRCRTCFDGAKAYKLLRPKGRFRDVKEPGRRKTTVFGNF
jgi:hypothetical protein